MGAMAELEMRRREVAVLGAVEELADVFADMVALHVGEKLTCHEANALARVFKEAGRPEVAAQWISGHALGDEDPDVVETADEHAHLADEDAALNYVRDEL
ncbi:hypothetical protein [Kineococcus esterisolvens]|uniref:hypothetical protein n=1 Tax=unclassified Kineococcus TaxID=2621656 RepID=UPI003D7CB6C6